MVRFTSYSFYFFYVQLIFYWGFRCTFYRVLLRILVNHQFSLENAMDVYSKAELYDLAERVIVNLITL